MSAAFKVEVIDLRREGWSVRSIARELAVPVDKIHENCGCLNGRFCTGSGCRIN